jgi:hypothetical protein
MSLPHYLVPMVTIHLTDTEILFFLNLASLKTKNIQWDELFMSKTLCRYGLQHYNKTCPITFLEAMLTTAPYEALVLPDVRALLGRYRKAFILNHTIKAHRPISILVYMFQLYNCSCRDNGAVVFCEYAAASNNIVALSWLRDPVSGDGVYPWSQWACFNAARCGHMGMLERLRDPLLDGGVCPWGTTTCWCAAKAGQMDMLIWLRDPDTGGGVCPWDKVRCLWTARHWQHWAVAAWIMAQPDDD